MAMINIKIGDRRLRKTHAGSSYLKNFAIAILNYERNLLEDGKNYVRAGG